LILRNAKPRSRPLECATFSRVAVRISWFRGNGANDSVKGSIDSGRRIFSFDAIYLRDGLTPAIPAIRSPSIRMSCGRFGRHTGSSLMS
jgi:hypothetical protein